VHLKIAIRCLFDLVHSVSSQVQMGFKTTSPRQPAFCQQGETCHSSQFSGWVHNVFESTCSGKKEPKVEVVCQQPGLGCDEARDMFYRFCNDVPPARVKPRREELEQLWSKCMYINPIIFAKASYDVLLEANSQHEWQPQVRAMCAFLFFFGNGEAGKILSKTAINESLEILQHVASNNSECSDIASSALMLSQLADALPLDEAIRSITRGGLMCFTSTERSQCHEHVDDDNIITGDSCSNVSKKDSHCVDLLDLSQQSASLMTSAPCVLPSLLDIPSLDDKLVSLPCCGVPSSCGRPAITCRSEHSSSVPTPKAFLHAQRQMKSPECFDVSCGDSVCSDTELSRMFSFQREFPDIPSPAAMHLWTLDQAKEQKDPFAFVADQFQKSSFEHEFSNRPCPAARKLWTLNEVPETKDPFAFVAEQFQKECQAT